MKLTTASFITFVTLTSARHLPFRHGPYTTTPQIVEPTLAPRADPFNFFHCPLGFFMGPQKNCGKTTEPTAPVQKRAVDKRDVEKAQEQPHKEAEVEPAGTTLPPRGNPWLPILPCPLGSCAIAKQVAATAEELLTGASQDEEEPEEPSAPSPQPTETSLVPLSNPFGSYPIGEETCVKAHVVAAVQRRSENKERAEKALEQPADKNEVEPAQSQIPSKTARGFHPLRDAWHRINGEPVPGDNIEDDDLDQHPPPPPGYNPYDKWPNPIDPCDKGSVLREHFCYPLALGPPANACPDRTYAQVDDICVKFVSEQDPQAGVPGWVYPLQ